MPGLVLHGLLRTVCPNLGNCNNLSWDGTQRTDLPFYNWMSLNVRFCQKWTNYFEILLSKHSCHQAYPGQDIDGAVCQSFTNEQALFKDQSSKDYQKCYNWLYQLNERLVNLWQHKPWINSLLTGRTKQNVFWKIQENYCNVLTLKFP